MDLRNTDTARKFGRARVRTQLSEAKQVVELFSISLLLFKFKWTNFKALMETAAKTTHKIVAEVEVCAVLED